MAPSLHSRTASIRARTHLLWIAGATVLCDVCLGGIAGASAAWPRPRLGLEIASVSFTPYVDFLAFREGVPDAGIPDRPEERLLEADDTDFRGFSVGLALHPDLEFTWTRHTGSADLRYSVDGQRRISGEQDEFGVTIALPEIDYTLQTFSLRWSPERLRWRELVGPTVGLGWGRMEQEQVGDLNLEGRSVDWGDTDVVVEMMVGAEMRVPWARAGFDLRLQRWRFEPDSPNFPAETVYARMLTGWVRLAF